MANAINYFLNQIASSASESCRAYFDFVPSNSNLSVLFNKSGDLSFSGVVKPSVGNFWQNTGSGYFSGGRYIEFTGIDNYGINNKDLTISLVYENTNIGGATLLSTIQTGAFISFNEFGSPQTNLIYKGFEFGITANNRLFFEYYRDNGPNIFISDFALADKNSIYLSITENNISFGYYDFFRNRLVSNNNYILTDYLFDYSKIFIGYNPNINNNYNFNKNYTGFIENLLIFSPSLYAYDLVNLNSGIAHIYNSGQINVETTLITGITGYVSGITGFTTGVTGINLIPTGILTNEWGVQYTGYLESGITGTVFLLGITGQTGIIAFEQVTGISGENISKNNNYINSFGKMNINLLSKINSEDLIDINLNTNIASNPLNKNINLEFQRYANNFSLLEDILNNSSAIVYVNGQLKHSGIFYNTGNIYNLSQYIVNDYYTDEINNFIFANQYNENDSVFVDFVTGYNSGLYIENFNSIGVTSLTGWNYNLYNFYFNGQKLTQNINYFSGANTDIIIFNNLFSGTIGKLLGIPKSTNYTITGSKNIFNINIPYLYNLSEIYKNGIRQTLDTDYLELAKLDTNTGVGFFDYNSDIIYNNDSLFNL